MHNPCSLVARSTPLSLHVRSSAAGSQSLRTLARAAGHTGPAADSGMPEQQQPPPLAAVGPEQQAPALAAVGPEPQQPTIQVEVAAGQRWTPAALLEMDIRSITGPDTLERWIFAYRQMVHDARDLGIPASAIPALPANPTVADLRAARDRLEGMIASFLSASL